MVDFSIKYFTIRGFVGNSVNIGFFIYKVLADGVYHKEITKAIDKANFSNKRKDWQNVGMYVGAFFRDLVGFRIPGFEYLYGQTIFRDLIVKKYGQL